MKKTLMAIVREAEREIASQSRSGNLDDSAITEIFAPIYKRIDEAVEELVNVVKTLAGRV